MRFGYRKDESSILVGWFYLAYCTCFLRFLSNGRWSSPLSSAMIHLKLLTLAASSDKTNQNTQASHIVKTKFIQFAPKMTFYLI